MHLDLLFGFFVQNIEIGEENKWNESTENAYSELNTTLNTGRVFPHIYMESNLPRGQLNNVGVDGDDQNILFLL